MFNSDYGRAVIPGQLKRSLLNIEKVNTFSDAVNTAWDELTGGNLVNQVMMKKCLLENAEVIEGALVRLIRCAKVNKYASTSSQCSLSKSDRGITHLWLCLLLVFGPLGITAYNDEGHVYQVRRCHSWSCIANDGKGKWITQTSAENKIPIEGY